MNLIHNTKKVFFSLFLNEDPSQHSVLNPKSAFIPVDLEKDVIYAKTASNNGKKNKLIIELKNGVKVFTNRTLKEFKLLSESFSFINKSIVVNIANAKGVTQGINLLLIEDKAFKITKKFKDTLKKQLRII